MPDLFQYQQLRRSLQEPRMRRGLWPERTPDILPLPFPPVLEAGDLSRWMRCLNSILPLPYQIIAFQTWLDLFPELLTEEQANQFDTPLQIVSAVIETSPWDESATSLADGIMQNGMHQGFPEAAGPNDPWPPTPQSMLRDRWLMLNHWWNSTVARLPFLAAGIGTDPEILERYYSAIVLYVHNFNRENLDDEGGWFFDRAVTLLLFIDTTPQEVLEDWNRLALPRRAVIDRLLAIGEFTPLKWPEIEAFVFQLFNEEANRQPYFARSVNIAFIADLAQVSTPEVREVLLAIAIEGVMEGREYQGQLVSIDSEHRTLLIQKLLEMDPDLYSDQLLDVLLETFPIEHINNNTELPKLIKAIGAVQTPRTHKALVDIWEYQKNLWLHIGHLKWPAAYKPETTQSLIKLLGEYQDPASREIYLSLWDDAVNFHQADTYFTYLTEPDELERVRDWLRTPQENSYAVIAAIKKVAEIPDIPLLEKILLEWEEKGYTYTHAPVPTAAATAIKRLRGEGYVSPHHIPDTAEEIIIELDMAYSLSDSAPYTAEAERDWTRIVNLTKDLKKKDAPSPQLINLLITIWETYLNSDGEMIRPFQVMDIGEDLDLDPLHRELTENEEEGLMEEAEMREWVESLNRDAYQFATAVVQLARRRPTAKSERWLEYISGRTSNCQLWKQIAVEPVVYADQWGDRVW